MLAVHLRQRAQRRQKELQLDLIPVGAILCLVILPYSSWRVVFVPCDFAIDLRVREGETDSATDLRNTDLNSEDSLPY